jgi:hypothetical protein
MASDRSAEIAALYARIDGLRDTDAVQRYQEYADMLKLADYARELEAGYAELTASWDNENRQKNRICLALELQSDLLADALGKITREGLSYSDLISEVKALRTALAAVAHYEHRTFADLPFFEAVLELQEAFLGCKQIAAAALDQRAEASE